jgi:hypothetical protein
VEGLGAQIFHCVLRNRPYWDKNSPMSPRTKDQSENARESLELFKVRQTKKNLHLTPDVYLVKGLVTHPHLNNELGGE